MKMKIIMRSSSLFAGLGLLAFSVAPVLAQDYGAPAGYGPSAGQIQQMQQQAIQQAQSQAQAPGQSQTQPAAPGGDYGSMPSSQNFGPPSAVEDMQRKGEEAAQRGAEQQAQQQLKGLQQGAKGMEQGLKQFEALVKKAEKAGGGVSAEVKAKYNDLKQNIQKIKAAKSTDEIGDIDTDSLQSDITEVMESAGAAIQNAEQLKGLKQGIKGMEQGLKAFEGQLVRITKQKAVIPAEITAKVADIKTKLAVVKGAKTWEEAEAAGVEELPDSMESLNDYRDQLEVLMRLPMMQKQLDKQMNNLTKELKRTQTIVTKLQKQGVDLNEEQAAFAASVNQLKTVRDNGLAQVKSGNSEAIRAALDDLEENFFGQIGDVMEHSRVIQTMAGLSRFGAELARNLKTAQNQINQLKRKKINTAELESLLNQAKQKGNEAANLIKVKPLDEDAVMEAISALEDLRTQFDDQASELGGGAAMPWESGPKTIQALKIPKEVNTFINTSQEKELKTGAVEPVPVARPVAVAGVGLLIEAENENNSNILPAAKRPAVNAKEVKPSWRPPYSGTGDWYLAAQGEWLSYDFTAAADGTYNVWVRDYVDKFQPKGVRRIVISFDGATYGAFAEVDKPTSSAKGDFGWHKVGAGVALAAGNHTMKVMKEETTRGAAILDAFYLTTGDEVPVEK